MIKVEIRELDRDYHTITGYKVMEFDGLEEAREYCLEQSWAGYDYSVNRVIDCGGDQ